MHAITNQRSNNTQFQPQLVLRPETSLGPKVSPPKARQALSHTRAVAKMGIETTLPGDLATLDTIGMGEGEPIWDRMAKIIRSRRLDCRQLMAGFDRSKKGFFDVLTYW